MADFEYTFIRSAMDSVKPILQQHCGEELREFQTLFEEKSRAAAPTIMVYGIYNHGKSTLINALLGKEAAEVGNRPVTNAVNHYRWEDFEVLDTPGIDAPINHAEITEAQLQKSEVVLFVLDSAEIEYARIWKELVDMAKRGQHACLIVNDSTGCLDESDEGVEKITRLTDAYRKNLQRAAQNVPDILGKIPLLFVNAKSALRAKLKDKKNLLEHSGLPMLEEHLREFFTGLPIGEQKVTLRRNLLALLTLCRARVMEGTGNPRLATSEKSFERIERVEAMLRLDLENELERLVTGLRAETRSRVESIADGNGNAETLLSPLAEQLGAQMSEFLTVKVENAAREIEEICAEYDKFTSRNAPAADLDLLKPEARAEGKDFIDTLNQMPWKEVLANMKWETLVKDGIVKVLQYGKETFPTLFRGVGTKTMGVWAARVVTALGPVVAIGSILCDLYRSYQAEEEARAAAWRKAQVVEDATENILSGFKKMYGEQLDAVVSSIFAPLKRRLSEETNDLRATEEAANRQLQSLDGALAMLSAGT
jgi:tRNA U34 5-carboxymethylaminomethyl modifying GTPase MnmE/TrmE